MMNCKCFFFLTILSFCFSTVGLSAEIPANIPSEQPAPSKKASKYNRIPIEDIFTAQKSKIETVADSIEFDRNKQKLILRGNVVLSYGEIQLTSDYAEVETDSKKSYAKGHVIIFKHGTAVAQGDEIHYDFENNTGTFPDGRSISPPWFSWGEEIEQLEKGKQRLKNATVTPCRLENPEFDIRASSVSVYENDKIVAKNVTFYILDKPFFWLPYLIIPLQLENPPFSATAGYSSKFGAYILTSKGFSMTKNVWGRLHADWRSKRGFGGGADLEYHFGDLAEGIFNTYWTQDDDAPDTGVGFAERQDRDRGRITWKHRSEIDPDTHLIVRYERLADEFFLQDFFEKEFRAEIEPQSFVTLTKNMKRFGMLVHNQKGMNDFESQVERLPQIRFDWKNQPFFSEKVYYENQISLDHMRKTFGRISVNSRDAVRIDNFHEWSAPLQWNDFKIMPYANYRGTFYSRELRKKDESFRNIIGYGVDLRTQYYKTYDVSFETFGVEVNQLRHLIEPIVQIDTRWSTISDEELINFDSKDRLDDAQSITFGLENRLQTKRVVDGKMQRVDFVSLNTFLSYEIHPDGRSLKTSLTPLNDGQTGSNFTIFSQEFVFRPYEWLQYETRADYDVEAGKFNVFNQDLIMRHARFGFLFGHRYIRDFEGIEGSNQFVFETKYDFNERWNFGAYIRWDSNGGDMEEWQVSATRDMCCFVLDFGYNERDSEIDSSNKELFFNLRLKAFPEYQVRSGARAAFASPRIGETVAGANQNRPAFHQYYEPY